MTGEGIFSIAAYDCGEQPRGQLARSARPPERRSELATAPCGPAVWPWSPSPGSPAAAFPVADHWGDFWRLTSQSAERLLSDVFGPQHVHVEGFREPAHRPWRSCRAWPPRSCHPGSCGCTIPSTRSSWPFAPNGQHGLRTGSGQLTRRNAAPSTVLNRASVISGGALRNGASHAWASRPTPRHPEAATPIGPRRQAGNDEAHGATGLAGAAGRRGRHGSSCGRRPAGRRRGAGASRGTGTTSPIDRDVALRRSSAYFVPIDASSCSVRSTPWAIPLACTRRRPMAQSHGGRGRSQASRIHMSQSARLE